MGSWDDADHSGDEAFEKWCIDTSKSYDDGYNRGIEYAILTVKTAGLTYPQRTKIIKTLTKKLKK